MLAVTTAAADAIKAIVSSSDGVPEEGGLRIATAEAPESGAGMALAVALAEEPSAGDQVVDEEGAHVFLEPEAAVALDDAVLDAQVEGGAVSFAIGQQPGAAPPSA